MFFLYAILSLSVIRMIPIAISLIGAGLRLPTKLFLGWFGPRGLASILFVLLILEDSGVAHGTELLLAHDAIGLAHRLVHRLTFEQTHPMLAASE